MIQFGGDSHQKDQSLDEIYMSSLAYGFEYVFFFKHLLIMTHN